MDYSDVLFYSGCSAFLDEDSFVTINNITGTFLEYRMESLEFRIIGEMDMPWIRYGNSSVGITKKDNIIYYADNFSDNIFLYDSVNHINIIIGDKTNYDREPVTSDAFMYNDFFYRIPWNYGEYFSIFDTKKQQLTKKKLPEMSDISKKTSLRYVTCIEDIIWMFGYKLPFLIAYNVISNQINLFIPKKEMLIDAVYFSEGFFAISGLGESTIYLWTPEFGIINTVELDPISNENKLTTFRPILLHNNILSIVLSGGDGVEFIDLRDNKRTVLNYSRNYIRTYNLNRPYFSSFLKYRNKFLVIPYSVDFFLWIDPVNMKIEQVNCKLSKKIILDYYRTIEETHFFESSAIKLDDYLNIL